MKAVRVIGAALVAMAFVPTAQCDKREFVAQNDDLTRGTQAIQKAIDAAWKCGGGEVLVSAGEWRIRSIRLRSGVTLRLQSGAHLWASRSPREYDGILEGDSVEPFAGYPAELGKEDLSRKWENAIIKIFRAKDVALVGEPDSFIDGGNCADPDGEEHYRGPHGVWCACSTNVTVRGVTLRNTGNWATRFIHCRDLVFADVSVRGGHDGVHVRGSDRVRVTGCSLWTGDDSVAGYANTDVVVSNCVLNSACSPVRFGGRNILITDCRVEGPAKYPHRWTLTDAEKRRGAGPDEVKGRRTMGCFFQPFSDKRVRPEMKPGNMVFRNLMIANPERFMVYLTGLGAIWQDGQGFDEIRFENVRVTGIGAPSAVVAPAAIPLRLVFQNCSFAFRTPQPCAFFGKDVTVVTENVKVENVAGPFYDAREDVSFSDVPEFPSWRIETPETRRQWGL